MSESMPITTAMALGKFRTELLERGISSELADDLVRVAARQIIEVDGLGVGVPDNA